MSAVIELFREGAQKQVYLGEVRLSDLEVSPWNPRQSRDESRCAELAKHIKASGYDVMRAVKVHRNGTSKLLVFAGGTRLIAAGMAGRKTIPAFEFVGYSDAELWRLAYADNEADGQHARVPIWDVWADYAAKADAGMTQQAIADALGVSRTTATKRIGWHRDLVHVARRAVMDGVFDEGHLEALAGVECSMSNMAAWLTTEQAQTELVEEVLGKHRGSTAGVKPSVKVVREAAARWKAVIGAAVTAYESFEGQWRDDFLARLVATKAATKARTEAAVGAAKKATLEAKRKRDDAEREDEDAEKARLAKLEAITAAVLCGDARELIAQAPDGFRLLLTDPPYGQDFQSGRRTTTAKKSRLANDGHAEALSLLADVLVQAYKLMAKDSAALVFTGWRNEPAFREAIVAAGFEIKGSLVWVKNNHGTGDLAGSFAPKHERIIHAVKGSPKLAERHPDVLSGRDRQNSDHPTEKPQDLLRLLINSTTDPDDVVVDPFAGSGSAILAAQSLGRGFWGCEVDEGWHRKIVNALQAQMERGE